MKRRRELSQQEIDAVFQGRQPGKNAGPPKKEVVRYDFSRPDRIAKSQLRAIHLPHDIFVRNLVSSLSAYLRSYVVVNLVSVEQLSYAEFLGDLSSPTCIACLGLRPYEGKAILELNSSLVFPILEMLLGGNGKSPLRVDREITKIEQSLLGDLFRIILRDLTEAWSGVSRIDFSIDSVETEPNLLQILAPSEAVVATAIEIRIGEGVGMMNIVMPSIILKTMRNKFDQQWLVRKSVSTEAEQGRMLELIRSASLSLDALIEGPTLRMEDLIRLQEGDVLCLDYPVDGAVGCKVNGTLKFHGKIVSKNERLAFVVEERITGRNVS